jgi:hypothetical protein
LCPAEELGELGIAFALGVLDIGVEEELVVEHKANAAYEAWRARGVAADGTLRMALGTTKPYRPPQSPAGTTNTTDPDSRVVKTLVQNAIQGYNAQAAVTEHQILVAAEGRSSRPTSATSSPWWTRRARGAGGRRVSLTRRSLHTLDGDVLVACDVA